MNPSRNVGRPGNPSNYTPNSPGRPGNPSNYNNNRYPNNYQPYNPYPYYPSRPVYPPVYPIPVIVNPPNPYPVPVIVTSPIVGAYANLPPSDPRFVNAIEATKVNIATNFGPYAEFHILDVQIQIVNGTNYKINCYVYLNGSVRYYTFASYEPIGGIGATLTGV